MSTQNAYCKLPESHEISRDNKWPQATVKIDDAEYTVLYELINTDKGQQLYIQAVQEKETGYHIAKNSKEVLEMRIRQVISLRLSLALGLAPDKRFIRLQ